MMKHERGRIGIVGGGLGGLTAACTLAAQGHGVTIFERNGWLGGKAAVLEEAGFRFDMGPTILIYPSVLRRIFSDAGRQLEEYLDLVPVEPQWRCLFEDGRPLDLLSDPVAMNEQLERLAAGSAAQYRRFLNRSEELHAISNRFFFWRSIGSIRDTFQISSAMDLTLLRDVSRMRLGHTVAGTVQKYVTNKHLAQMLEHLTQYVGSAPDASPAVLCAIAHMQTSEGVWYPRGGTREIPAALGRLARELGVDVKLHQEVEGIWIENRRVRGVTMHDGTRTPFDAIVCNSDIVRSHRELIGGPPARRFERRRSYEPACSGVVLYLGLSRQYDHLAHHTFAFSRDPHEEFEAIYRQGRPASDPTCYLCAPSRTDPTVAPPGGEALYILVHTPYLRPEHDWRAWLAPYRQTIFEKLARTAGLENLERRIVYEHVLTPEDIRDRYRVLDGAIYGLASHGRLQGGFKPANHSPDVEGLYFAGGAAHPGPGMPMVMMSGWIAANRLIEDGILSRPYGPLAS
jgi:phytoene desaturase